MWLAVACAQLSWSCFRVELRRWFTLVVDEADAPDNTDSFGVLCEVGDEHARGQWHDDIKCLVWEKLDGLTWCCLFGRYS